MEPSHRLKVKNNSESETFSQLKTMLLLDNDRPTNKKKESKLEWCFPNFTAEDASIIFNIISLIGHFSNSMI